MNLRRSLVAGAAVVAVLGATATAALGSAPEQPAKEATESKKIHWKDCPTYSDEVLEYIGVPDIPTFRRIWSRMDCGTLRVPLDYSRPAGRSITVAFTRLPATDQANRRGSLALNPGGPGGSGYLLPVQIAVDERAAKLNERYDLIGFDPRGVGYSSTVDCESGAPMEPDGSVTERQARKAYVNQLKANLTCAMSDPAFLGQLTTGNIARDLDRIRVGLGDRELSYFGVSWGSWLGPVYRSLFPGKVDRMWVDSVAPPDPRLDEFEAGRSMATDRNFSRMAAWMARFDDTYGFGDTGAKVEAALTKLRKDFEANPRKFTDVEFPITGFEIALLSSEPSIGWPTMARVLADLRDATGAQAPDSLKELIGDPPGEPPAGVPEQFNPTAGQAIFCNGDGGARDFDSEWDAYRDRVRSYPVTGVLSSYVPACAGWPLEVERIRLRDTGDSLQLSGHRHESVSIWEWTGQMHEAVGGNVFTVEDDVHGSALMAPDCVGGIVEYFATGSAGADGCQGIPVPSGPDDRAPLSSQPLSGGDQRWAVPDQVVVP